VHVCFVFVLCLCFTLLGRLYFVVCSFCVFVYKIVYLLVFVGFYWLLFLLLLLVLI